MSLFLSGISLYFMGSFDFNQISNIDTLKCRNFARMALWLKQLQITKEYGYTPDGPKF